MLTLYVRTGCPYCAKVLAAGEELGVDFNLKNIADAGVEEELIHIGGEAQVPFLIDEEASIQMYESDPIVAYLHDRFGEET
jgi:glutaredoxin 3